MPGADGDDVLAALDAVQVRLGDGLPRGRVRIVRIGLARLAPVRALVLCGLEAGVLPRREPAEAAGSAELRRALTPAGLPGDRPRQEERDRFLFAAALARVDEHLALVRRATDDDSLELAPSPFWDEVVRVLGDSAPIALMAPAHALDGHDERERLQAIAALARKDAPSALARARAHGGRAGAAHRARAGGLAACRRACATVRCWRASPARRPTPSPSSRRSRPARRCGSSSGSCTRATSSSRSTSASPAA